MGKVQQVREEIVEYWYTPSRLAIIESNRALIIDTMRSLVTIVNHGEKSYIEAPLPLQINQLIPAEVMGMIDMLRTTAFIKPYGQNRKIGQWNCQGYDI